MSNKVWHKLMEPVHHDNPWCQVGQLAVGIYQRAGTGGKPLCQECARLSAAAARSTADRIDNSIVK